MSFFRVLVRTALLSLAWVSILHGAQDEVPPPEAASLQTKGKRTVREMVDKMVEELKNKPPKSGAVICIGSSQMAKWKTIESDLSPLTVYNHGISGSKMAEAADLFVEKLVIPFSPRAVVLYEGSNDLVAGVEPEGIKADFERLHKKVRAALPGVRIYVLGLVPSPGKRFARYADTQKTNALLKAECEAQEGMYFIDTTTPLLGADGTPRMECFIPGDIHMTSAGYAVWKDAIAPVVLPKEQIFEK